VAKMASLHAEQQEISLPPELFFWRRIAFLVIGAYALTLVAVIGLLIAVIK
jgi:hypothetical protein